jgi:hypothetical protein
MSINSGLPIAVFMLNTPPQGSRYPAMNTKSKPEEKPKRKFAPRIPVNVEVLPPELKWKKTRRSKKRKKPE